jgi:hypothetical protein
LLIIRWYCCTVGMSQSSEATRSETSKNSRDRSSRAVWYSARPVPSELRVSKGVGDSVCGDGIGHVAGVTDERPALAPRLADEASHAAEEMELAGQLRVRYPNSDVWRRFLDDVMERANTLRGGFSPEVPGERSKEQCVPVVGRDRASAHPWAEVPAIAIDR